MRESRQGLRFDGIGDYVYLQLPSITMDAIKLELEVTRKPGEWYILDARTGLTNGYISLESGIGAGWNEAYLDGNPISNLNGIIFNNTCELMFKANSFTDDVTIGARYTPLGALGRTALKGKIYSITCYLDNEIVAHYPLDEGTGTTAHDNSGNGNDGTIVGATWLQRKPSRLLAMRTKAGGKNLCPTDANAWEIGTYSAIPGNPLVLSDSNTTRIRRINISIKGNTTYTLKVRNGYQFYLAEMDIYGIVKNYLYWSSQSTFTTNSQTAIVAVAIKLDDTTEITPDAVLSAQPQLELGSTATDFEPYIAVPDLKQESRVLAI